MKKAKRTKRKKKTAAKRSDSTRKRTEKKKVVRKRVESNEATKLLANIKGQQAKKTEKVEADRSHLPEKPTISQIKRAANSVQPSINSCYGRYSGGAGPKRVKAKISVSGKTGKVSTARITTPPYSGNEVGTCMNNALRTMKFRPFKRDKFSFQIPFVLR